MTDEKEKAYVAGYEAAWRRMYGEALMHLPNAIEWHKGERHDTRAALEVLYEDTTGERPDWGEMHMADCVRQLEKAVHQLPLPTDEVDDDD